MIIAKGEDTEIMFNYLLVIPCLSTHHFPTSFHVALPIKNGKILLCGPLPLPCMYIGESPGELQKLSSSILIYELSPVYK